MKYGVLFLAIIWIAYPSQGIAQVDSVRRGLRLSRVGIGIEGGTLFSNSILATGEAGIRSDLILCDSCIRIDTFIGVGNAIYSYNILFRFDRTLYVNGDDGLAWFYGIAWMKPFQDVSVWKTYGNHHHPPSLITSNWLECFLIEGGMKVEFWGFALEAFVRIPLIPTVGYVSHPRYSSRERYVVADLGVYYLFKL